MRICIVMHVVHGPPGKQRLAEGGYPVEIKVNNNNFALYVELMLLTNVPHAASSSDTHLFQVVFDAVYLPASLTLHVDHRHSFTFRFRYFFPELSWTRSHFCCPSDCFIPYAAQLCDFKHLDTIGRNTSLYTIECCVNVVQPSHPGTVQLPD